MVRERRIPPPVPGFQQVQFSARLCRCDIKNSCRDVKSVPHDARTETLIGHGGGKPEGKEGEPTHHPRDEKFDRACLNPTDCFRASAVEL